MIIANFDGYDKHTVLKPDTDKGYDHGILSHVNQILSLYSPIPDTDYYSSYMRVPIFFNERDAGFYNTPAIVNNMSKLKRIATDEKHLRYWVQTTDRFQSDQKIIKDIAVKIEEMP